MTNTKAGSKTVFVTVGTTRFDNLVRQVVSDEMCQKFRQAGFKRMIVQTGSSPIPIKTQVCGLDVHCFDYKSSIQDELQNADLVISHAGAGTVLETLSLGKPLITVVNEKLMNNHQIELAQQMYKDGHSFYCTCSTLPDTLTKIDVESLQPFPPGDPSKFGEFMDKLVTIDKIELRVLIRYCWKRGLSTRKAAEEICAAEGEGTIAYAAISKWYKRFDSGDMSLGDKPRSGRPLKLDVGDLQTKLSTASSSSTRKLADELGVGKSTIHRRLKQLDFVHKKPRQESHELSEAQANRRVEICRQLLSNPLAENFW